MYLHSWKRPKKVDKISNNVYLEISLHTFDSIGKSYPRTYSGVLLAVFTDRIVMNVDNEIIEKRIDNGTLLNTSNTYILRDTLQNKLSIVVNSESLDKKRTFEVLKNSSGLNEKTRTINISSISSVYYSKSKKIANVGIALMVLSAVNALLVAPPASINFRNGNFNENTYYSFLTGSGCAFAVGLPLFSIFTKTKQYRIKNYAPESSDSNYYSIQTN